MSLDARQRWLVAAAFVTALGTGYVAGLDEDEALRGPAAGTELLAARPALSNAQPLAATEGGQRAMAWLPPAPQALQAWGDGEAAGEPAAPPPASPARMNSAAAAAAGTTADATAALPEPAPALPWRFIGRIDDGPLQRAMLATPQQMHVVAEGDTLDGRWRVQRIEAHAVELLWLPTAQTVRLAWEAP
jgi:hypothetical protein